MGAPRPAQGSGAARITAEGPPGEKSPARLTSAPARAAAAPPGALGEGPPGEGPPAAARLRREAGPAGAVPGSVRSGHSTTAPAPVPRALSGVGTAHGPATPGSVRAGPAHGPGTRAAAQGDPSS